MSNFSAFFAIGKRASFDLKFLGKIIVDFNLEFNDLVTINELGPKLDLLIPDIVRFQKAFQPEYSNIYEQMAFEDLETYLSLVKKGAVRNPTLFLIDFVFKINNA